MTDASDRKRMKVISPKESADLRSLASYVFSGYIVLVDLSSYAGDPAIAASLVGDAVNECGGMSWTVNPMTIVAAPYNVTMNDGE